MYKYDAMEDFITVIFNTNYQFTSRNDHKYEKILRIKSVNKSISLLLLHQ